ncbi:hypothetical protein ES703_107752 [subsurface metagenome]
MKPALEGLLRGIPVPILSDDEIGKLAMKVCHGEESEKALEDVITRKVIEEAAETLNEFTKGGEHGKE